MIRTPPQHQVDPQKAPGVVTLNDYIQGVISEEQAKILQAIPERITTNNPIRSYKAYDKSEGHLV